MKIYLDSLGEDGTKAATFQRVFRRKEEEIQKVVFRTVHVLSSLLLLSL
jgi:hypothetical protein